MTGNLRLLVESGAFRRTMIAVIVLAGVVAGLETSPAILTRHGDVLLALDRFIVGVFVAEVVLKMAAEGGRPWRYFGNGWNVFDFAIVLLCLLPAAGSFAAVLRLARILRLLRLVSALPKLQLLVSALMKSLSAMGYVGLLLALLFYMYAVVGVHLLGRADPENFGSLPVALLSLFRVVTLDNWGDLFNRALEHQSGLKVGLYFVTFIILGTMIILNLFIGIIMNSMTEAHSEQARTEDATRGEGVVRAASVQFAAVAERLASLHDQIASLRAEIRAGRDRPGRKRADSSEKSRTGAQTDRPTVDSSTIGDAARVAIPEVSR